MYRTDFNKDTYQAKEEIEFIKTHPKIQQKKYTDVDSMFEDILSDIEENEQVQ